MKIQTSSYPFLYYFYSSIAKLFCLSASQGDQTQFIIKSKEIFEGQLSGNFSEISPTMYSVLFLDPISLPVPVSPGNSISSAFQGLPAPSLC